MTDTSMERRHVLVTGGGSGIGLACARNLVGAGAVVTLAGRSPERLDAASAALVEAGAEPTAVRVHAGDVTDEAAVEAMVATAVDVDGGLHGVVASAGGGSMNRIETTSTDEWRSVVDLVATGTFLTLRAAIGPMTNAAPHVDGGASFVAVSSLAGHRTHRFMTPYAVAKAGLDMLVANAADELGDRAIRVNSVRPGLIDTGLVEVITGDDTMRRDYVSQTPMGRVGTADDVAEVVTFLLGPRARWVTGSHVPVDGGHHLRRGPDFSPWFSG